MAEEAPARALIGDARAVRRLKPIHSLLVRWPKEGCAWEKVPALCQIFALP